MTSRQLVRFERFILDLDRLCLQGPSGPVELRRKSFDVLRYLVDHPGRVVTKDELLGAIWSDVTVGEESLTQCVSEIRRAIADSDQRIIKTIPRRGYLLDVRVSGEEAVPSPVPGDGYRASTSSTSTPVTNRPDATRRQQSVSLRVSAALAALLLFAGGVAIWRPWAPADPAPSIAVLPFSSESDEPVPAYLAAGMTGDLIAAFAKLPGLTVVPRSTALLYDGTGLSPHELGRQLNVRYLLLANASRAEGTIRVRAHLWDARNTDAKTNGYIWQETITHEEIFELQSALKKKIVAAIGLPLGASERRDLERRPAKSFDAYLAYLDAEQSRTSGTWRGLAEALVLYDKALALDADFIDAHIGNARASLRVWRTSWFAALHPLEAKDRLDRSLQKVFALEPRNAEALGLRPEIALWLMEHDRALQLARTAVSLHPESPEIRSVLAWALVASDLPAEARVELQRTLESARRISPEVLVRLAWNYILLGDAEAAIAVALRAREAGHNVVATAEVLANAYAQAGDVGKARAEVARLQKVWASASIFWYRVTLAQVRSETMRARVFAAFQRAGIPEKPYGFSAPEADRLSHGELMALFHARKVKERGTSPAFAWDYELTWEPDGRLGYALRGPTPLALDGRWAIEGDKICYRYKAVLMDRPYCVHIYRDPKSSTRETNRYVRADMFGIFRFTVEALEDR